MLKGAGLLDNSGLLVAGEQRQLRRTGFRGMVAEDPEAAAAGDGRASRVQSVRRPSGHTGMADQFRSFLGADPPPQAHSMHGAAAVDDRVHSRISKTCPHERG